MKKLIQAGVLAVLTAPAYAQSAGGTSATTFLNNVATMLTGTLGQAIAVLAIIGAGLAMLFGRFSIMHLVQVIGGIMIMFSGAWILGQITGGSGGL